MCVCVCVCVCVHKRVGGGGGGVYTRTSDTHAGVETWSVLTPAPRPTTAHVSLSTSQDLNKLAAIVRGELPKLSRAVLCALITLDVHARDMVTGMVKREVSVAWCFLAAAGSVV